MKKDGESGNEFGLLSVVFGVLSIVSLSAAGIVMGILAVIFAYQQNKRDANKWSKAGKILGIIGIVLGIIMLIVVYWAVSSDLLANLPTA